RRIQQLTGDFYRSCKASAIRVPGERLSQFQCAAQSGLERKGHLERDFPHRGFIRALDIGRFQVEACRKPLLDLVEILILTYRSPNFCRELDHCTSPLPERCGPTPESLL